MAVVTASIYRTTENGIDADEDRNWILGGPDIPVVQIWTTTGDGFHSTVRYLEVHNYARIETGYGYGAVLDAKYQTWFNEASGEVRGHSGMLVEGGGSLISNEYQAGIVGHGTDGNAILIDVPDEALVTQIINRGTIAAGDVAIRSVSGTLYLKNMSSGVITGDVALSGRAHDVLHNSGAVGGTASLGRGQDLYDARGGGSAEAVRGGRGADKLIGGDHDDLLLGGRGTDVLRGGKGDDVLIGGRGRDVLKGGAGDDVFVFKDGGKIDRIKDFTPGEDVVQLENAYFRKLGVEGALSADAFHVGGKAADADDRIVYNAKSGVLKYDANGDEAGGVVKIAKLDKGLDLTHHHFEII